MKNKYYRYKNYNQTLLQKTKNVYQLNKKMNYSIQRSKKNPTL